MAIATFLAMTAAEMALAEIFPHQSAWMACHFSPYGTGLTNLPESLPPDSLLILNDRTPIHGHDPQLIADQLSHCLEQLGCRGLLLDFQRPDCEETQTLVKILLSALPCPVGVTEFYVQDDIPHPVFLPPVPPSSTLESYLSPWIGRELWLELALDGACITLTEEGSHMVSLPDPDCSISGFQDETLHCHYSIQTADDLARFTLWRTPEDLKKLITAAESLGITACVGLYQEFKNSRAEF